MSGQAVRNGIGAILNVLWVISSLFGAITAYAVAAPKKAADYTDIVTGQYVSRPATPFNLETFILVLAGWIFVSWIIVMVLFYIIGSFSNNQAGKV